jgi:hypothetical protein
MQLVFTLRNFMHDIVLADFLVADWRQLLRAGRMRRVVIRSLRLRLAVVIYRCGVENSGGCG